MDTTAEAALLPAPSPGQREPNEEAPLLGLPEVLLNDILAILATSVDSLKTVRLTCRAIRTASNSSITHLSYDCRIRSTSRREDMMQQLPKHLNVLTAVTYLDLHVTVPECTAMLEALNVCSILRKLHLVHDCKRPTSAQSLEELALLLAAATQLSAFGVDRLLLQQPGSRNQLLRALSACRGLEELRMLGDAPAGWDAHEVEFVLSLRGGTLRTLHFDSFDFFQLIASQISGRHQMFLNEPCLTQLRSLGFVRVRSAQHVMALARLTNLTHLSLAVHMQGLPLQTPLSEVTVDNLTTLTSLRVLSIIAPPGSMHVSSFMRLVRPMEELRELSCRIHCSVLDSLDFLLASFPSISDFTLSNASPICRAFTGESLPNHFVFGGFACLRHLSIALQPSRDRRFGPVFLSNMNRFRNALTGLESLKLLFCTADCRNHFLTPQTPMPRLYELNVTTEDGPTPPLSAQFLEAFPQLRTLKLTGVLDGQSWDNDVRHITALKDLKQLELKLYPPWQRGAPVMPFTLTGAQAMPLTALRHLDCLSISNPWTNAVRDPEFQKALRRARVKWVFHPP